MHLLSQQSLSLSDTVFQKLEERILSGVYKDGENLTEVKISQELGVSRTPVREALKQLAKDGLIEIVPNKGAVVVPFSEKDITDIYEIRMKIEGLASRKTAIQITDEQIKELREVVDLQEFYASRLSEENIKKLDSVFHQKIYEFTGSKIYEQILSILHHKIKMFRKTSMASNGRAATAVQEHREIFEAIANHNPDLTEKLVIEHITNARDNLTKTFKVTEKDESIL